MKPPILKAVPEFGTDTAPRWAICNLNDRSVWTGEDFSSDWKEALIYAHPNAATWDMSQIVRSYFNGQRQTLFEAPTRVEVYGEVEMEEVQRWLSRASRLQLQTGVYGNGPGETLVLPGIHWGEMQRVDQ